MSDLFATGNVLERKLTNDFLNPAQKATELNSHIGWMVTQRKSDLVPQLFNLAEHKSKSVRRKAVQAVAQLGSIESIPQLKQWQLKESDRETWLLIESAIDRLQRGEAGEELETHERIYSVGEALGLIKKKVSEKPYTIEGELSEVRPNRQIYWLALKDGQEVRLDGMLLNHIALRAGFPLNDGLQVRATGTFKISSKSSKLFFDIHSITLTGEGELLRNMKQLEEKLSSEGLFDPERKRQLKRVPQNILLIASESSAAVTDFCRVLGVRRKGVKVYLLPIKTQGVGAEYEVLEQLKRVGNMVDQYNIDTVVMTRGGGSKDDLNVFNSEKVVRAIHGLPIPIIVAIGHERDVTLAELVADVRASTPSQAAELSSWSTDQLTQYLHNFREQSLRQFQNRGNEYKRVANSLFQICFNNQLRLLQEYRLMVKNTDQLAVSLIHRTKNQVEILMNTIRRETQSQFEQKQYELKLVPNLIELSKHYHQLFALEFQKSIAVVQGYDCERIVAQGYAIIRQQGEVMTSISEIDTTKTVSIHMQDGSIETRKN
jgi:exodeoxyribonuclease VII large subunit